MGINYLQRKEWNCVTVGAKGFLFVLYTSLLFEFFTKNMHSIVCAPNIYIFKMLKMKKSHIKWVQQPLWRPGRYWLQPFSFIFSPTRLHHFCSEAENWFSFFVNAEASPTSWQPWSLSPHRWLQCKFLHQCLCVWGLLDYSIFPLSCLLAHLYMGTKRKTDSCFLPSNMYWDTPGSVQEIPFCPKQEIIAGWSIVASSPR